MPFGLTPQVNDVLRELLNQFIFVYLDDILSRTQDEHIEQSDSWKNICSFCSLFFTWFNFSLSYRPGSRNIKPAALSRQFAREEDPVKGINSFLPPSMGIAALTSDREERVQAVSMDQNSPRTFPTNCLFVPDQLRSEVLEWGFAVCNLQRFWWPSLENDVTDFVKALLSVIDRNSPTRHMCRTLPKLKLNLNSSHYQFTQFNTSSDSMVSQKMWSRTGVLSPPQPSGVL